MRNRTRPLGLVLAGLLAAVWLAAGAGSSGSPFTEDEAAAISDPHTPSGDAPPASGFRLTPIRFRSADAGAVALWGSRTYGWTAAVARPPFARRRGADLPPAAVRIGLAQPRLPQG